MDKEKVTINNKFNNIISDFLSKREKNNNDNGVNLLDIAKKLSSKKFGKKR